MTEKYAGYGIHNLAGLAAGPVLFVLILAMPVPEGMTVEGHRAGAVVALMATWWLTEALPLAATALLPIALFPLMGVLPGREVTLAYAEDIIFLFAGGFFIAMAIQKWNLHERIALHVVYRVGRNIPGLVFGFMAAAAFLSMWISNTATALMMTPIAVAVLGQIEEGTGPERSGALRVSLLLGIAYACSIGGIATLIGTPPNGVLISQFEELYPAAPVIGFLDWMLVGVPLVVIFLPLVWFLLTHVLYPVRGIEAAGAREEIRDRLTALGPMTRGERVVAVVGGLTALSWIFRGDIELGAVTIPGWANLFPAPGYVRDSTVAIFYALVLFVIPINLKKGEFALDWEWARRIPWGILLLFGGGLALAKAFADTGLVGWFGEQLTALQAYPPIVVILGIALTITFLTELTSNTATTTIMLPIVGGAGAVAMGVHPLLLMIPATLSASCAFMMPVATPPNAVVFGSGQLTIPQMAKAGILINFIGAGLITLLTYFLAVPVFGIEFGTPPAWMPPAP